MNQLVQYLLIFGIVGVFFAALYTASADDIGRQTASQRERLDQYKAQAAEIVRLVDILSVSPASIDVVNAADKDVRIRSLYVDGTADPAYLVDGLTADLLPAGRVSRIDSSLDGTTVALVTESGRVFRFG